MGRNVTICPYLREAIEIASPDKCMDFFRGYRRRGIQTTDTAAEMGYRGGGGQTSDTTTGPSSEGNQGYEFPKSKKNIAFGMVLLRFYKGLGHFGSPKKL